MGVYSTVHVCMKASYPQPPGVRARVVELCHEHGLLRGECAVLERQEVRPRTALEWIRATIFASSLTGPFGDIALGAHADPRGTRGTHTVHAGEAGAWLMETVAATSSDAELMIWSGSPRWKNGSPDAGFSYAALTTPVEVRVGNAYGARRSPFDSPDGKVGSFYDLLTLSMRNGPDGRSLARSKLVKQLKQDLGVDVTCRASHW